MPYCCKSLSEKSSKLVVRYNTEEICFRKVSFTVSNFFCWGCCPATARPAFSRSSFNWPRLRAQYSASLTRSFEQSDAYRSLDGVWKFRYADDVRALPADATAADADTSAWSDIRVPGNWELQGHGTPIYVNTRYEYAAIDPAPPHLPEAIPAGVYRRTFTVPEAWAGRRIYLTIGGAKSGVYVYVNGREAGYNEDSKNPAQYRIDPLLRPGENTLALKMTRWSTGSYLEAQDFWRISGIERTVYLSAETPDALRDFEVVSTLDDSYRTGLFTSPHLQDFRERIRVDGEMIPKQKVVNFVDKHHGKMVELELSFFEMTAALAFDYFAQSDVEVAVIETGLGGRLDATNIIVPLVSVITNVGLDHTALLGDTLPKIAAEKAGIIKKSIPVVIGESDPRYNDVIEQTAAANKSKVIYAEQEFSCEPCPCGNDRQHFCMHRTRDNRNFEVDLDLGGNYQRRNMVTAAATVDFLHEETPLTISRRAFLEGARDTAANTSLMGRWQKLGEQPLTVCDTGHNPHGIAYVARQLKATPHKQLYCVIGFVRDKDLAHILPLLPHDAHYIFTQAKTERAFSAAELTAKAAIYGLHGETVTEVPAAVARAKELAGADDMIFIGGSTYVVAEAL